MHEKRDWVGPFFSEGSRQLWLQMERYGASLEKLRARAGLGGGVIHRYLYGDRRPDLKSAYAIFDHLDIDPRLFILPPKKLFVLPANRALQKTPKLKSTRRSAGSLKAAASNAAARHHQRAA